MTNFGVQFPIFDWQIERVYKPHFEHRHLVANKFTGAGMTSLFPRLATDISYNHKPRYTQFAVVTGTNMELAVQILQGFFLPVLQKKHPELIKSVIKEKIILSNDDYIRAYPTDHIDALRGQKDLEYIFIDEAAFFHPNQQERIRNAIERNEGKTDPWIVWNSTPNGPSGAYYNIYDDAIKGKNSYHPITLNYRLGLDCGLLDPILISNMMRENPRRFAQEYDNQFLQPVGAEKSSIVETDSFREVIL